MEESFENMVTVALTATDDEIQIDMVREALHQGQQHQFVHVDEHQKMVAELKEHEEKLREHEDRILALEAEVRVLKEGELRRRSNIKPQNEYGGCSSFGAHDASPLHQTPHTDIYADMGGVGCSDVEAGAWLPNDRLGLLSSPREHADDANINPPSVLVCGLEGAHIEVHTGEDNADDASNPTSNIATRIKDKPRTRFKSVRPDPPLTRAYVRKSKMTVEK